MTDIITAKRVKIAAAVVAVVATGVVAATRFPGTSSKAQSYITAPVTTMAITAAAIFTRLVVMIPVTSAPPAGEVPCWYRR